MKKIPTFLVGGFLDGGKTSYIIHTLKTDTQIDHFHTLVVVLETGEVEYDENDLKKYNTDVVYINNLQDFNGDVFEKAIKKSHPDRIIVELNGMWDIKDIDMPANTEVVQTILFVDGETFPVYFNNMRQKFTDMLKYAQVVCFTKVKDLSTIANFQTPLRLINPNTYFYTVNENNKIGDAFETPIPYDIKADVINIKDEDFGFFYIDSFEKHDRYEGKVVEFDAQAIVSDKFTDNSFLVGRWIMNCCANDVQLYGFPVHILGDKCPVTDRQWVHIKAKISYEYSEQYQEEECFLTPIDIVSISPKEEVLNLTGNN